MNDQLFGGGKLIPGVKAKQSLQHRNVPVRQSKPAASYRKFAQYPPFVHRTRGQGLPLLSKMLQLDSIHHSPKRRYGNITHFSITKTKKSRTANHFGLAVDANDDYLGFATIKGVS